MPPWSIKTLRSRFSPKGSPKSSLCRAITPQSIKTTHRCREDGYCETVITIAERRHLCCQYEKQNEVSGFDSDSVYSVQTDIETRNSQMVNWSSAHRRVRAPSLESFNAWNDMQEIKIGLDVSRDGLPRNGEGVSSWRNVERPGLHNLETEESEISADNQYFPPSLKIQHRVPSDEGTPPIGPHRIPVPRIGRPPARRRRNNYEGEATLTPQVRQLVPKQTVKHKLSSAFDEPPRKKAFKRISIIGGNWI
ncbi:hypothetical protein B0J12DRAFT_705664 [Macrophomina phaseolina]|uniref:Uncharacterized protein n=1 Tax=Macrophomina phaseolina TaxID=35725 RepID=A0ABQ8FRH7_9PEZI|nr:hypothetical protein B0J12DRAFT_705664 [Macrophomina phaseolina]